MPQSKPGYYAVIPSHIRYGDLSDGAKLLYGEITALSEKEGYCFATNAYLADLYGVTKQTIRNRLNELKEVGAIRTEESRGAGGTERKIYIKPHPKDSNGGGNSHPKEFNADHPKENNGGPLRSSNGTSTVNGTRRENGTVTPPRSSNDSLGGGATGTRAQGADTDEKLDPDVRKWANAGGDGALTKTSSPPPEPAEPQTQQSSTVTLDEKQGGKEPDDWLADVPTGVKGVRDYIESAEGKGDRHWRLGQVFAKLFAPWWESDDLSGSSELARLIREANRMVGEKASDGSPIGKPQSRVQTALALLHLYNTRDDLHGRSSHGARKDQPTAALNVLAEHISRKVIDDNQEDAELSGEYTPPESVREIFD